MTKFIGIKKVRELVPLGKSTIYTAAKEGKFPKPIQMTSSRKSLRWRESEIHQYIEDRLAARNNNV